VDKPVSVESLAIALHHSRAKGAGKLVLIGIANHDGDGGAWPSVATLAKYSGVTPRQVQKLLGELEAKNEIRRLVSAGGDHSTADHLRPNLYQFRLVCPPGCDRTRNHRVKGEALPDELSTGVSWTTPGVVGDRGGVSSTTPEPSLNQTTRDQEESRLIARAPVERPASPELYRNTLLAKCSKARNSHHRYESSGYCLWCSEHRDDHRVNTRTGEVA
jgi:hypothetical protein